MKYTCVRKANVRIQSVEQGACRRTLKGLVGFGERQR